MRSGEQREKLAGSSRRGHRAVRLAYIIRPSVHPDDAFRLVNRKSATWLDI